MSDNIIRKMTRDDIPAVAAIEAANFSQPWSEELFSRELENPQAVILVADIEGEVAGFADMRIICGECYINNIAVSGRFRHRGIGEALMKGLESAASGAEFITLEVRQSNERAIALYRKRGFVKVGVRKDFYEKPTESADLMTKILKD